MLSLLSLAPILRCLIQTCQLDESAKERGNPGKVEDVRRAVIGQNVAYTKTPKAARYLLSSAPFRYFWTT